MILWMSTSTFTTVHVVLSLIGIAAGLVVLLGMLTARKSDVWVGLFLLTTILTTLTGFLFPITKFTPALGVGLISLVVLAATVLGYYFYHLEGQWRLIYVVCAIVALYFNVFVAVVQAFDKFAFLKALAPTQTSPLFIVTHVIVLAIFVVLGLQAVKKFQPEARLA